MKEEPDQKKTILLVDDAPANIQVANAILKDIYKVRIAISGAKALELANAMPPPDLILLDVGLLNGIEAARRILKLAPATKIIFVSRSALQSLRMKLSASAR